MIPFFRKTRKKLADDNKPMKYMRYAIGEIALVVIGILIALSVNNWNEERKLKIETKKYIQRLISDIESDTTNIHNGMKVRNETIINIKAYFDFFDTTRHLLKSTWIVLLPLTHNC